MQKVLIFFVFAMMAMWAWSQDNPNNPTTAERPVIFNGTGNPHRLIEVQPEGWYYYETQVLTIEFPVVGFEPYTLSVSSKDGNVEIKANTTLIDSGTVIEKGTSLNVLNK